MGDFKLWQRNSSGLKPSPVHCCDIAVAHNRLSDSVYAVICFARQFPLFQLAGPKEAGSLTQVPSINTGVVPHRLAWW